MVATKLVTVEELEQYAGDERYELIRGELVPMPPSSSPHAVVVAKFTQHLGMYLDDVGRGRVFSGDPGIVIERDPDTVLAPDVYVSLTAPASFADIQPGYSHSMPDIAIEVFSDSDTWPRVRRKAAMYLAAGVPHVWVVHPVARTVTWFRSGQPETKLGNSDVVDGGDVLPGFRLPLDVLFR